MSHRCPFQSLFLLGLGALQPGPSAVSAQLPSTEPTPPEHPAHIYFLSSLSLGCSGAGRCERSGIILAPMGLPERGKVPDFSGNGDLQLLPSPTLGLAGRLPGHRAACVGAGSLPSSGWHRPHSLGGHGLGTERGFSHRQAPPCNLQRGPLQPAAGTRLAEGPLFPLLLLLPLLFLLLLLSCNAYSIPHRPQLLSP